MMKYVGVWMMTLCVVRLNGTFSNVAFQKPATMSSVFDANTIPSRGVDGNTYLCTVTNYGDMEPWWMVDLHGYFHIHDVIITNYDYLNWWRYLHSFTIDVFTENPIGCARATPVQCYNRTDTLGPSETVQFKCRSPVIGRFVRVKKWKMVDPYDPLTLCEVQVLGTKATAPTFKDSTTITSSWDYYGVDLC
ncbi:fucolectin-6-like [Gigantopelta aegis]|uniref:fucolectin-6-like n=1 Tax=Gigantopelta aegis TaxID=1735272 RepID=UPI001B887CA0|nr:fucolectin-6-like [Gigantopelta aegis]